MFNPLSPAEMIRAAGRATREVARSDGPMPDFARAQLLAAQSVCRQIAVEVESFTPAIREFADEIAALAAAHARQHGDTAPLSAIITGLANAVDGETAGRLTCELLDALRRDRSASAAKLVEAIRTRLGVLVDYEVALLAAAIEQGSKA